MKLLIDTHILLWWLSDDAKLPENARQLLATPDNAVFVSHASLWEIQIKAMAGKLTANLKAIIQQLQENNFQQLPCDKPMHLLTHDKQLGNYSELVILV